MFGFGWLSKMFGKKHVVRMSPPKIVPEPIVVPLYSTRSTSSYRSSSASPSRSNTPKSGRLRDHDLIDDEPDFITSMAVAHMTNNTMMGTLAGGSISGAVVGDLLNDGCIGTCQQPEPETFSRHTPQETHHSYHREEHTQHVTHTQEVEHHSSPQHSSCDNDSDSNSCGDD